MRCWFVRLPILLMFCSGALSCSGGGGDGGGGGRTTDTALRIIHGSVDEAPVSLLIEQGGVVLPVQTARFAQATSYVPVEDGVAILTLERAGSSGSVITQFPVQLNTDTEYTLFVLGETRNGTFRTTLLQDIVSRPESGTTLVQVLNAYASTGSITVSFGDTTLAPLALGGTSGFIAVPTGTQTFVITGPENNELARLTINLVDRGEITIVIEGSADLGVNFTSVFDDLD